MLLGYLTRIKLDEHCSVRLHLLQRDGEAKVVKQ